MDVREYLWVLRKRWRVVLAFLLLGLCASAAVAFTAQPEYASTTQLFVSTRQSDSISELLQGGNFSQQRVKSYAKVATTSRTLQPVIERLRLDITPDQLAQRVSVEAPLDTVLINITVRERDPRLAADIANAIGSSVATVVGAIEAPSGDLRSPVTINTVRNAEPSVFPVSPNIPLDTIIGLLAGAVFGVAAAVARNALDTVVRNERDIQLVTDAVRLGGVPLVSSSGERPEIIKRDQRDLYAEAFRKLRTNLQFVQAAGQVDSLVVTSAVQGEGKTTVAANLAVALAHAGIRTVLVDADLRRPRVAQALNLVDNVGLTTVLLGRAQLDDVLQSWGATGLKVLASGESPPNPSELVGSPTMLELIRELEQRFDIVIIDTPPLLPVTDAALLSTRVTGCLLVVGAGKARRRDLTHAVENMGVVGARVLGVVLNLIPRRSADGDSGYGYGYYYTHRRTAEATGLVARLTPRRLRRRPAVSEPSPMPTAGEADGNGARRPVLDGSKRRPESVPREPSARG